MPWCLAIQQQMMFSVLDTYASQITIGAELSQIKNGIESTIGNECKVLASTKWIYCTTRKELLAIVCFTRHFRHYLLGRQFVIRTDHSIWIRI